MSETETKFPEKLGPYRLKKLLGRGGMGAVFRAHDERLGRDVALKVMLLGQGGGQDARENEFIKRFAREVRAQAAVNHPHIVGIFDAGEEGPYHFFAMELLAGEPLKDYIKQRGALLPTMVISIGIDLADALATMHERNMIHRDLKPQNVFACSDGRMVVMDLGLVKVTDGRTLLTQQGQLVGTPMYMPPECIRGKPNDARSDIYQIGTILYEAATGQPPFDAKDLRSLLMGIARGECRPPSAINPGVPPSLDRTIMWAMAVDPQQRAPTARALHEALVALRGGGASVTVAAGTPAGPKAAGSGSVRSGSTGRVRSLTSTRTGTRPVLPVAPGAGDRSRVRIIATLGGGLAIAVVAGLLAYRVRRDSHTQVAFVVPSAATASVSSSVSPVPVASAHKRATASRKAPIRDDQLPQEVLDEGDVGNIFADTASTVKGSRRPHAAGLNVRHGASPRPSPSAPPQPTTEFERHYQEARTAITGLDTQLNDWAMRHNKNDARSFLMGSTSAPPPNVGQGMTQACAQLDRAREAIRTAKDVALFRSALDAVIHLGRHNQSDATVVHKDDRTIRALIDKTTRELPHAGDWMPAREALLDIYQREDPAAHKAGMKALEGYAHVLAAGIAQAAARDPIEETEICITFDALFEADRTDGDYPSALGVAQDWIGALDAWAKISGSLAPCRLKAMEGEADALWVLQKKDQMRDVLTRIDREFPGADDNRLRELRLVLH